MIGEKRIGKRAEQKRRWDNENLRSAAACTDCGQPVWKGSTRCRRCEDNVRRERFPEIARRWNEGESLRQIAAALDTTYQSIQVTIHNMRAAGWDLPYRYSVERREAARERRWAA